MRMALPESTSFVNIDLLDGGSFIASTDKLHADVKSERFRLYNWAFHIFHPSTGEHIMWDLGISGSRADFNPWANKMMDTLPQCSGPRKSILTQLSDLGVHPEQISRILFSHAHWDHCHPIHDKFPSAKSYFGPGTREHCTPSFSPPGPDFQWEARFFDPNSVTESWEELDNQWTKFGPFDSALDFLGDGSLWIIQAPGHMPGNLCAVARLKSGDWVLLGGDCCHSSARGLLDGQFDIATFQLPNGESTSLHADIPAAKETIKRMKKLETDYDVHIALAHDASWMRAGTDRVLMSLLTDEIKDFVKDRLQNDEPV